LRGRGYFFFAFFGRFVVAFTTARGRATRSCEEHVRSQSANSTSSAGEVERLSSAG